METVTDFIWGGSKITADCDCSHERCLLLGGKVMTNWDSILKRRDITLPTKVHLVKAMEKEMATYSSILAWTIPGTEEPGGLPSMGWHRVRHDWSDLAAATAGAHKYSSHLRLHAQLLSCVWFFVTLWAVAHQVPLSMGFSRQEYWSGLPFPSP